MAAASPRLRVFGLPGFLGVTLAALLAASSCGGGGGTPGPGGSASGAKPNVLLIAVDTLRADHLGAYGFRGDISPHVDALARRGVRLERYTTVVPTTLASFTSMLTGKHPHTHGVFRNGVHWPDGLEGIPSAFRKGGYETAAFIASYCLSSEFGVAQGFDRFDQNLTVPFESDPNNKLVRPAAEVTAAAVSWLTERRADRPFFAMVHYFDPHAPYQPPPPYDTMFDPGYRGPVTGSMGDIDVARRLLAASRGVHDANTRHLEALYAGEIRYADDEIGKLLLAVDRLGLAGNTLVVLTSDHGETLAEHDDYFNHGPSVYDTEIRIPLIVAGPGIGAAGGTAARPACNIDLAPTLLEYAGLPIQQGFEGHSFLASLRNPEPAPSSAGRLLFAEATKPQSAEQGQRWPNRLKARCVLRGAFKVIHTPWLDDRWELYDLASDPLERKSLWGGASLPRATVDELARALDRWSRTEPGGRPPEAPQDEETLKRLRALGYVD
jgi:arylsulfatase A-like enzyme